MSDPPTVKNHPVIGVHRPHHLLSQLGIQVEHHQHGRVGRSEMHISCGQGSNIAIGRHDCALLCLLSESIENHLSRST